MVTLRIGGGTFGEVVVIRDAPLPEPSSERPVYDLDLVLEIVREVETPNPPPVVEPAAWVPRRNRPEA